MPTKRIAYDTRADTAARNAADADTKASDIEAASTPDRDIQEVSRYGRLRPNGPGGTFVLWDGVVVA